MHGNPGVDRTGLVVSFHVVTRHPEDLPVSSGHLLVQDSCWCPVHRKYILAAGRNSPSLLKRILGSSIYHFRCFFISQHLVTWTYPSLGTLVGVSSLESLGWTENMEHLNL